MRQRTDRMHWKQDYQLSVNNSNQEKEYAQGGCFVYVCQCVCLCLSVVQTNSICGWWFLIIVFDYNNKSHDIDDNETCSLIERARALFERSSLSMIRIFYWKKKNRIYFYIWLSKAFSAKRQTITKCKRSNNYNNMCSTMDKYWI